MGRTHRFHPQSRPCFLDKKNAGVRNRTGTSVYESLTTAEAECDTARTIGGDVQKRPP